MPVSKFAHALILAFIAWLSLPAAAIAQKMHYLGIAASNRESVFNSEASGAGATLASIWPLASSQVVAGSFFGGVSYQTVRQALKDSAGRMDLEKDVLFLLVTSHGAPNGGGVELSAGGAMTARMLKSAMNEAGIRTSVVLVSACYSGQFIGPLAGPNTIVITAANASNPSFGCSNKRSYTYFGDAFFNYGLQSAGSNVSRAFAIARQTVTQWERRDGERPSQPQISVGKRASEALRAIR